MTRRDLELHAGPDPIRAAGDVQADDVLVNGHQDATQHVCCAHAIWQDAHQHCPLAFEVPLYETNWHSAHADLPYSSLAFYTNST